MRIISGKAGSIRLQAPPGTDMRPSEDRLKEALFGSLGDLSGKNVLDLFAGSGALGLEALSRGAKSVILVEKKPAHVGYIEQNLAAVRKAMAGDCGEVRILTADVQRICQILPELAGTLSVVLADPPYNPPAGAFGGKELLQQKDFVAWVGPDCLLALEHQYGDDLPFYPRSAWRLLRQKRFGSRAISYLRQEL